MMPLWLLIVTAYAAAATAMVAVWWYARRTGNAGWVDVVWSAGIGVTVVYFCFVNGDYLPRSILIAAMTGFWSLRLAFHLSRRVGSGPEDGRYAELRQHYGQRINGFLFWFFQFQAELWSNVVDESLIRRRTSRSVLH